MPPSIATMIRRRLGNTGSPPGQPWHPIRPAKENHAQGQSDALLCCVVSFRISPERSRTAYIRIGVKVDANSKRTLFLTGRASVWPARPAGDEAADIETSVGAR